MQALWYQRHKNEHRNRTRIAKDAAIRRNLVYVQEYLRRHPCVDCGENDTVVLEFDHVRGKKIQAVSRMVQDSQSIETIEEEILKCEVRCANCHRRITHKRRVASIAAMQRSLKPQSTGQHRGDPPFYANDSVGAAKRQKLSDS